MSIISTAKPYAWPYHGSILPRQTALVICVDDDAAVEPEKASLVWVVATELRAAGGRVVHLLRQGCSPLQAVGGDLIVWRSAIGGFYGSDLALVLDNAGLTDLLFVGFPAELGADCTMREANDLGFECLLLSDCSSGLSDDTFAGALSSVQMSGGIFGAVATAGEVLSALESA